jgi:hypothetical protein
MIALQKSADANGVSSQICSVSVNGGFLDGLHVEFAEGSTASLAGEEQGRQPS